MNIGKALLKRVLSIGLIVLLIISNVFTIKLYLETFTIDETKQIDDSGEELSMAKYFIKDWYDELSSSYNTIVVYKNELRFEKGLYTLTAAGNRIRAVYPRGVRFFNLSHIRYIEFFEESNHIQCRFYFNETGETVFKLN